MTTTEKEKKLWNRARRESGLARFERGETKTQLHKAVFFGRTMLAYTVPGTSENYRWHCLQVTAGEIYDKLLYRETEKRVAAERVHLLFSRLKTVAERERELGCCR